MKVGKCEKKKCGKIFEILIKRKKKSEKVKSKKWKMNKVAK